MKTLEQAYREIKTKYPDMGISDVAYCHEFFEFDLVPKGKKISESPYNPVIVARVEGMKYDVEYLEHEDCPSIYSVSNDEIKKVFSLEDYALYEAYMNEIQIN